MSADERLQHTGSKLKDDVADDATDDLAGDCIDMLTWRVNPTHFAEPGRRRSVARVRRVGARGQSGRWRV